MSKYELAFNKAKETSIKQGIFLDDHDFNSVDDYSIEAVVENAINMYKFVTEQYQKHNRGVDENIAKRLLVGECQSLSLVMQESLWEWHKIKSTITIGDVLIKGVPKYGITESTLAEQYKDGYDPSKPLLLHVWLTLQDLTVVDLTVAPSEAWHKSGNILKYKDMVTIITKGTNTHDYEFIPIMLGADYLYHVNPALYSGMNFVCI